MTFDGAIKALLLAQLFFPMTALGLPKRVLYLIKKIERVS
jgi:hypothetical protein